METMKMMEGEIPSANINRTLILLIDINLSKLINAPVINLKPLHSLFSQVCRICDYNKSITSSLLKFLSLILNNVPLVSVKSLNFHRFNLITLFIRELHHLILPRGFSFHTPIYRGIKIILRGNCLSCGFTNICSNINPLDNVLSNFFDRIQDVDCSESRSKVICTMFFGNTKVCPHNRNLPQTLRKWLQ